MKLPKLPSNRKFGLFFFVVFLGISAYVKMVRHAELTSHAFIFLACFFLLLSIFAPNVLQPLNLAWFKLGELMGRLVNPFVMGILFFLAVTPIAIITRFFGRDELLLKKKKSSPSYWVNRDSTNDPSISFKNQF